MTQDKISAMYDEAVALGMVHDARAELLVEQASWDAGMSLTDRAAAIAEEIRATESGERKGSLPDSWSDSRTSNLLGNYVTS